MGIVLVVMTVRKTVYPADSQIFQERLLLGPLLFKIIEKSFVLARPNTTPALPEERRNGIINMEYQRVKGICFDNATNSYIEIPFAEIGKSDLHKIKKNKWNFNWFIPMQNGYRIYALVIANEEIQGLIALKPDYDNQSIVIDIIEGAPSNIGSTGKLKVGGSLFGLAAYLSFQMGFDGYVYFDAKSELVCYYREKYRAVQIGNSQRMVLDTQASRELINTFIREA